MATRTRPGYKPKQIVVKESLMGEVLLSLRQRFPAANFNSLIEALLTDWLSGSTNPPVQPAPRRGKKRVPNR